MITRAALAALLWAIFAGAAAAPEPVKRLRYPALSPDGKTIAFSYQGDLWRVPAEGGRAVPLTTHAARDVQPVFSPDGEKIVFASNRHGNYDLFLISAEGGPARRLTYHSSSEYPSSFTPDGRWVIYYGSAYGSSDIYRVSVDGGEPIRLTWDYHEREYFGSVSPDGQWIVYSHNSSPGSWRRRGYEGSSNADVWMARLAAPLQNPVRLTTNPGHDFTPQFSRDGRRIYYVSDRKGQVNLWSMDLKGGGQKQHSHFTRDGVRLLSCALRAERAVYEYDSEIWLQDLQTGKSARVPIEIRADERINLETTRSITANPSEYAVSPDGKKVALVVRGDLFVVPAEGGPARPLVRRPSRESHVAWMPDSRTILFSTDGAGSKDVHSIEISGANERVLAGSPEDETAPLASPDGRLVAYHQGDRAIVVIPRDGGAPVAAIAGGFLDVSRQYAPRFDWSPDGKWLAFKHTGEKLEDAIYAAPLADPRPRRLSRAFRDTNRPRWSPDGKMVYFSAVPVDSANLYAVDLVDEEPPDFPEDALDKLDRGERTPVPVAPPAVSIDFDQVESRLRRVTGSGGVNDALMTSNGRAFLVETAGGVQMIPADAREASGRPLLPAGGDISLPRDGSRLYFRNDGQIHSLGLAARDQRTTSFTAEVTVHLPAENLQVFREAWWVMDRYFYDDRHNGVDWKGIRQKYEVLLPFAPYKEDFYDLLAEMVQEVRGSHVGVTGASDYTPESPAATAYLGIEPDWQALDTEGRVRIGAITPRSPAAAPWCRVEAGDYILAVDGVPLGGEATLDRLLDRKVGKKVVLTVNGKPGMDGARQVALKPISQNDGEEREYERWVEERRKLAHQLSGGRVAYLHVRAMNGVSEARFKEEFVAEATGRQALLVDVRYNGGGNVAHRLLDILRKKPYVTFRPRSLGKHVVADWPADYLWGKPAALLVNQASASNSEMMAEGFRVLGIGPVVGVPTAGAVIATGTWRFLDGGTIRTPASGVYTADGEDFELRGRKPDLLVPYDPLAIRQGRDPQLEAAVRLMVARLPAPAAAAAEGKGR